MEDHGSDPVKMAAKLPLNLEELPSYDDLSLCNGVSARLDGDLFSSEDGDRAIGAAPVVAWFVVHVVILVNKDLVDLGGAWY